MTKNNWERRYSFRLTNGDEELNEFLTNMPNNKRSEVIRNLLRYAYRHLMKEQHELKQLHELKAEIEKLNSLVDEHYKQILKKLEDGVIMKGSSTVEENKEDVVSDDAVAETAMGILSAFNIDLD